MGPRFSPSLSFCVRYKHASANAFRGAAHPKAPTVKFFVAAASAFVLLALPVAHPAPAQPLVFTPQTGLTGASHGDGSLQLFMGRPRAFHVRSRGTTLRDGTFVLDQTIRFESQPLQSRSWRIRDVSPLHYGGTLSDAPGAVSGYTVGPRLLLEYRVKGPLVMHQVLELMPDGKTIDNVGRITLFGMSVGTLHETIRRDP